MNNAATNIDVQVSGEFRSCHLGKYLGNRIVRLYYKGYVHSIYFLGCIIKGMCNLFILFLR